MGQKNDARKASLEFKTSLAVMRSTETPIEVRISSIINGLPFVLVEIPDEPGPIVYVQTSKKTQ